MLLDLSRSKDIRQYAIPLVLGLLLRIFLLFFDVYGRDIYSLPNSGADTEMFYSQSIKFLSGKSTRSNLFINTLGTVFRICGVSRVYAQFLLVVCSMVSLVVLAKILSMMKVEHQYGSRTVTVISLLPNYAILSSILLRESLITMFVSLSVFALAKWMVEKRWYWYYIALFISVVAILYHSGVVAVTIGLLMVRLIYDNTNSVLRISIWNILITIILVVVLSYLSAQYADSLFGKFSDVSALEDVANTNTAAGSSYTKYVGNSSSIASMVLYTPLRIFYFLYSPLPWQWRGSSDIIAFFLSSIFYLWGTFKIILYFVRQKGKKNALIVALLITFLLTVFVFSWGTSNTGTAARHRDKLIIMFALIWGLADNQLGLLNNKGTVT